jgi:hypothetical protein
MIRGMFVFSVLTFLLLAIAALGGCGTGTPVAVGQLKPAPTRCMASPEQLGTLSAGQSLVEQHGKLRRSYVRETSKLRCAQLYIRTITSQ